MNHRLQVWRALVSCSCLHDWNNFLISSIFCTSVALLLEEVGRDAARYWSHESGEGLAEFLVSRCLGDIGSVRGEDDIFNGIIGRGIHGLNGVRNGEDVWFPGHPYMRF